METRKQITVICYSWLTTTALGRSTPNSIPTTAAKNKQNHYYVFVYISHIPAEIEILNEFTKAKNTIVLQELGKNNSSVRSDKGLVI